MIQLAVALACLTSVGHGRTLQKTHQPGRKHHNFLKADGAESEEKGKSPEERKHEQLSGNLRQSNWQIRSSNAWKVFALLLLARCSHSDVGWLLLGHRLVLSANNRPDSVGHRELSRRTTLLMQKHANSADQQLAGGETTGLHNIQGLLCREVPIEIRGGKVGLVTILEATHDSQKHLVNLALGEELDATTVASAFSVKHDDPYGTVLWPAARATVNYLLTLDMDLSNKTLLEVGAGTGLVSLAASQKVKEVLATDYEEAPLTLIRHAAGYLNPNSGKISTALFDITDFEMEMPPADIVIAADIMYLPSTGRAMAKRVFDAMRRGSRVIVGDTPGRAGRPVFLEELRSLLEDDTIDFVNTTGTTCQGPRHDLICGRGAKSVSEQPRPIQVGILDLSAPVR